MSKRETKKAHVRKHGTDSLFGALRNAGPVVWLSCLVMGLGNFAAGQPLRGIFFLGIQAAGLFFLFLPQKGGLSLISRLPGLGDRPMQEIWNEELGVYEYVMGDNSQLILLYGVVALCVCALLYIYMAGLGKKRLCVTPD